MHLALGSKYGFVVEYIISYKLTSTTTHLGVFLLGFIEADLSIGMRVREKGFPD